MGRCHMIVTLNDNLKEIPDYDLRLRIADAKSMFSSTLKTKFGINDRKELADKVTLIHGNQQTVSHPGLIGLLSHCYTNHLSATISPDDIWTLIVSQIAQIVLQNTEALRDLFTDSKEKKKILVQDGGEIIPVDKFASILKTLINFDASIITPTFSTSTAINAELYSAALCDIASPYYSYSMFMCGIKSINITGTRKDWKLIIDNISSLTQLFIKYLTGDSLIKVINYVSKVITAVKKLTNKDSDWINIFTQQNIGSGSELSINGWILDFIYDVPSITKLENFTNNVTVVPYHSESHGKNYVAIYGGFSYNNTTIDEQKFIGLEYSKIIFRDDR